MSAKIFDPLFLLMLLAILSVVCIVLALLPSSNHQDLQRRMKFFTKEKKTNKLFSSKKNTRKGIRAEESKKIRSFVERLDLKRILVDEKTILWLSQGGYRTHGHLLIYVFFRFLLPVSFLCIAFLSVFSIPALVEQPLSIQFLICLCAGYMGFYLPVLFMKQKVTKRQKALHVAYGDALDLMLICVQAGISVEATLKRVADEIRTHCWPLYEELTLTIAEMKFLGEKKQAYENLILRTGVESIKATAIAFIQADQYGTPVMNALRTVCEETRQKRQDSVEKKAAALSAKLTVPMILFFIPVLFAVILGPAIIQISQHTSLN